MLFLVPYHKKISFNRAAYCVSVYVHLYSVCL